MNKYKPKVILAQLNVLDNAYTIPLASGYLKAMAYKAGLLRDVDIEILNIEANNVKSDANLISYIVQKKPISVGFSCYVWNIDRTIYIIKQIKARMPKVKIICGGSEVASQHKKFMLNKNIDIIVIGEGELIFVEILRNFLFSVPKLEKINGIVFRENGKIIATPKSAQIPDINMIPSPYLLGFIEPKEYGAIMIETYRGCIGKCTYCNWNRNSSGIRYFSAERISDEIKLAVEKKVNCNIIDTIFNLPENLSRLSKQIKKANQKKSIELGAQACAEYINEDSVHSLSECNVTSISIGLQSVNKIALKNVNRWFNKKLFIRGLKLLEKKRIIFRLDVIIGLPGDTADSVRKTARFVKRYNRKGNNYFDILQVQPDAVLRKQAKDFDLKYLKKIPYYVLSTNTLSHRELRELGALRKDAVETYSKNVNMHFTVGHQFASDPSLSQENCVEIPKGAIKTQGLDNLFSNIAFEIDNSKQSIKQVKNLAIDLGQFVALDSKIILKCGQIKREYLLVREFLRQISEINPFSNFNIFIENDDFIEIGILNKLQQAIVHMPNYQECRTKFYADLLGVNTTLGKCDIIILQLFSKRNLLNMKRVSRIASVIWKIFISQPTDWKALLLEALSAPYGDLLINFDSDHSDLIFTAEVLKYIYNLKKSNKRIIFSDYAMQLFYSEVLINKKSLPNVLKILRHNFISTRFKMIYVDTYFNKTVRKYNVTNGILKLVDISNAYKFIR